MPNQMPVGCPSARVSRHPGRCGVRSRTRRAKNTTPR